MKARDADRIITTVLQTTLETYGQAVAKYLADHPDDMKARRLEVQVIIDVQEASAQAKFRRADP